MDSANPPIRVLLVDDHPSVRRGLSDLISDEADMEVVGAAGDGEEAIAFARDTQPDIILMDVSMPRMDGMEATRRVAAVSPESRIIMLTSFSGRNLVTEALQAGAVGYVLKDAEPDQLLNMIRGTAGAARSPE